MSLTDANGGLSAADVAAVMGNNGNGFGFGGDGAWWFILLILLFANNGWGNGYGNSCGVGSEVQRGFDQSALVNGINGINSTLLANQNATTQSMNSLAMGLQNCCCENRAATADLKYTMASEAAATRANCDANNQKILDKLCQLELDGVKGQLAQAQRENLGLQNQVNMAAMQASQTAQTAQILAGQAAEIDGVYNRLKNCPVPSMPVYGNQPIFTCGGSGCGCGGTGFVA